jgi:hypothetical protein
MTTNLRTALGILAIVASLGLAAGAAGFETPAVNVVVDSRLLVKGARGEGLLPIGISQDWSRPLPAVTRAVIIVHGAHRTAAGFLATIAGLLPDSRTLVVAPQFLLPRDIAAHSFLSDDVLRWDHWVTGADAVGPAAISSYEAMDTLVATLADRARLPNLATIVVAGFSGGGQFVQRYAAVGRGSGAATDRGIALRYVIGSPSSYVYFDDARPASGGGFTPFAGTATCPNVNRWPYGLAGGEPRYVTPALREGAAAIERRYAGLDLIYLLGTADNDPNHWELDRSCAGEAEGPDRYDRGVDFFRYVAGRDAAILKQRLWFAPGAAHDGAAVFASPCGRAALFDVPGCPAR